MLIYLLLPLLSERFILSSNVLTFARLIKFKILQPEMLLTSDTGMLILRDNV